MATLIANNTAYLDVLAENKKQFQRLKRDQRTISSRPRKLAATRRNKFLLKKQANNFTKHATGYVPNIESSAYLEDAAVLRADSDFVEKPQVRIFHGRRFVHVVHWSRNGIRRSVFSLPKTEKLNDSKSALPVTAQFQIDNGIDVDDSDDELALSPLPEVGALEYVVVRPLKSFYKMFEGQRAIEGEFEGNEAPRVMTLSDQALAMENLGPLITDRPIMNDATANSPGLQEALQEPKAVVTSADSYLVLQASTDDDSSSNIQNAEETSLRRFYHKLKESVSPVQVRDTLNTLVGSAKVILDSGSSGNENFEQTNNDGTVEVKVDPATLEWASNFEAKTMKELEFNASPCSTPTMIGYEETIKSVESSVIAQPASISRDSIQFDVREVAFMKINVKEAATNLPEDAQEEDVQEPNKGEAVLVDDEDHKQTDVSTPEPMSDEDIETLNEAVECSSKSDAVNANVIEPTDNDGQQSTEESDEVESEPELTHHVKRPILKDSLTVEARSEYVKRELDKLDQMRLRFRPLPLPPVSPYCDAVMQLLHLDHLCQSADDLVNQLEPRKVVRFEAGPQSPMSPGSDIYTVPETQQYDHDVSSYFLHLEAKKDILSNSGVSSPILSDEYNFHAYSDMLFDGQLADKIQNTSATDD